MRWWLALWHVTFGGSLALGPGCAAWLPRLQLRASLSQGRDLAQQQHEERLQLRADAGLRWTLDPERRQRTVARPQPHNRTVSSRTQAPQGALPPERPRRATRLARSLGVATTLWSLWAGGAYADADTPLDPGRVAAAARRYRHEPGVRRVVQAALRSAQLDPERADALASSARAAGWIPELRFGVRRGLGRDLSALSSTDSARTRLSADDDLALEATLSFDLARLVFHSREVSLLRERRAIEDARHELAQLVVQLYFERRRLQLERDLRAVDAIGHAVRIQEIEALLDAFTGGAFGRMIRGRDRQSP